jgi:hypothetical protein
LNRSATNDASKRKSATIKLDDALILRHCANPAGSNFWEPQDAPIFSLNPRGALSQIVIASPPLFGVQGPSPRV